MDIKQTIVAQTRISATLEENGDLSLKAFASAEYGPGMTTSVDFQKFPAEMKKKVSDALAEALAYAAERVGQPLGAAIHKSTEVAASFGEL